MNFSERLRELRGQRKQKEMAELFEVKLNTYINWEKGIEPRYAMLIRIAKQFNVSVDYLLGVEDREPFELEIFCKKCGLDLENFWTLQLIKERSCDTCNLTEMLNMLISNLKV